MNHIMPLSRRIHSSIIDYRLSFALLALIALTFCSCRGPQQMGKSSGGSGASAFATDSSQALAGLPIEAYTGHPGDGYTEPGIVPPHMQGLVGGDYSNYKLPPANGNFLGTPLPLSSYGPWMPPGIGCPWPEDEYIFDGGDNDGGVKVRDDWVLEGLDLEDTVAHYDTLAGDTIVKPTNRVCIYAPRFAAVRKVNLAYGDGQLVKAGGLEQPLGPISEDEVTLVTTAIQPVQPVLEIGERAPITFLEKQPPVEVLAKLLPYAAIDRFKPYENFDIIRRGVIETAEKPFLAQSIQAAIQWTGDQGVQVILEGHKASVLEGEQRAQATFRVDLPNNPCLRVCKVASTPSAAPGEEVEFTIRFDNVGDQTIGNVTIVDNLTTRLEYIEGSGQASVKAAFSSQPNQGGSLVLRWELAEPLKPGDGGIARFKCKVR